MGDFPQITHRFGQVTRRQVCTPYVGQQTQGWARYTVSFFKFEISRSGIMSLFTNTIWGNYWQRFLCWFKFAEKLCTVQSRVWSLFAYINDWLFLCLCMYCCHVLSGNRPGIKMTIVRAVWRPLSYLFDTAVRHWGFFGAKSLRFNDIKLQCGIICLSAAWQKFYVKFAIMDDP